MAINLQGKKVAVVGSRSFERPEHKERLYKILDKNRPNIKLIVSGGARGADTLATEWATERGVPYLVFPAKWWTDDGEYDRGAGFRRNRDIVEHSDVVVAFWDGESRGTAHTMEFAKQLDKPVRLFKFDPPPKLITFAEWEKTKGGLCCSQPTCIHQEPPAHIQVELAVMAESKKEFEREFERRLSELFKQNGMKPMPMKQVVEEVKWAAHQREVEEAEVGLCEAHMGEAEYCQCHPHEDIQPDGGTFCEPAPLESAPKTEELTIIQARGKENPQPPVTTEGAGEIETL